MNDRDSLTNLFRAFYDHFLLRDLFGKILPGLIFSFFLFLLFFGDFVMLIDFMISFPWYFWVFIMGIGWALGFAIQSFGEWSHLIIYYPVKREYICCLIRWLVPRWIFPKNVDKRKWTTFIAEMRSSDNQSDIEWKTNAKSLVFDNDSSWYEFRDPIVERIKKNNQLQENERFVVIKECCGNVFLSLLWSLPPLVVFSVIELYDLKGYRPDFHELLWKWGVGGLFYLLSIVFLVRMHFVHVWRQHWSLVQASRQSDYVHA